MWKLHNYLLPQSNSGWFSLSNSVLRKRLNLSKYRIPNPRIGYTKKHNIYSATKLWNTEIPIQLKQSTSLKNVIRTVWSQAFDVHLLLVLLNFIFLASLISTEKTFTAYTVYLHSAALWLVKWIEMTVPNCMFAEKIPPRLSYYPTPPPPPPPPTSKNFDFVFFQSYGMCQIYVTLSLAFLVNFFTLVRWNPDRTSGLPYYLFLIIYSICMFSLKYIQKKNIIVYFVSNS